MESEEIIIIIIAFGLFLYYNLLSKIEKNILNIYTKISLITHNFLNILIFDNIFKIIFIILILIIIVYIFYKKISKFIKLKKRIKKRKTTRIKANRIFFKNKFRIFKKENTNKTT